MFGARLPCATSTLEASIRKAQDVSLHFITEFFPYSASTRSLVSPPPLLSAIPSTTSLPETKQTNHTQAHGPRTPNIKLHNPPRPTNPPIPTTPTPLATPGAGASGCGPAQQRPGQDLAVRERAPAPLGAEPAPPIRLRRRQPRDRGSGPVIREPGHPLPGAEAARPASRGGRGRRRRPVSARIIIARRHLRPASRGSHASCR